MGCGQSSEAPSAPQDDNYNAPNRPVYANGSQNPSSGFNSSVQFSNLQPASHPPNKRPNIHIRSPSPVPTSPTYLPHHPAPWPRSLLEKERVDFFDTRVTGRSEVWDALRVAAEMIRAGEVDDAQGILDAVGLSCPTGRVASGRSRWRGEGGVYDERGELYDVPPWVLKDPNDVVEDEEKGSEDEDYEGAGGGVVGSKGKGRAQDPGEIVAVRARSSDGGSDLVFKLGTKQPLGIAVASLNKQVPAGKKVRLAYLGKILGGTATLESCGWSPGHVLNALMFEDLDPRGGTERI